MSILRVLEDLKNYNFCPCLVGDSIGVKEGGVLSQSLNQIEISCFPTDVPEQIELNEDLELNSAKSVADLEIDIEDVILLQTQV